MIRAVLALSLFLVTAAQADEPRNPAIEGVIQSQMRAFLADDVEAAFTYASPAIKGIFGSHQRFGVMVQRGYPMVWRHRDVKFLELRELGGQLWQKVLITDVAGNLHLLDYQMIEAGESWKINGVQILRLPQVGA